jgi:hypothetical protein
MDVLYIFSWLLEGQCGFHESYGLRRNILFLDVTFDGVNIIHRIQYKYISIFRELYLTSTDRNRSRVKSTQQFSAVAVFLFARIIPGYYPQLNSTEPFGLPLIHSTIGQYCPKAGQLPVQHPKSPFTSSERN